MRLNSLECLLDGEKTNFFLFCDSSKKAYGVVIYAVQNGVSQFVFSKPKVAPLKNRTLPQLELLGALVGLQSLINILNVYKHIDIRSVYLALDVQVAFLWILSPIKV